MPRFKVTIEFEDGNTETVSIDALDANQAENEALDNLDARCRAYVLTYWSVEID